MPIIHVAISRDLKHVSAMVGKTNEPEGTQTLLVWG